jgi:hypothetical protein
VQLEGKEIIRKVEGACLAGRLPWMSEGQSPVLQPIRANVRHFKKPWFDSVEVRCLGPRGEEETANAELRLLFEADFLMAFNPLPFYYSLYIARTVRTAIDNTC